MLRDLLIFVLRVGLVAAVWVFVWRLIRPKTQVMRIVRAALLALGLLIVLAAMRVVAP